MRRTSTGRVRPHHPGTPAHAGHVDHRRMHEAVWTRDEAIALLESPERLESEDAQLLWRRVGLRSGMTVVDVGAGTGYYALPACAAVGPTGKVYAVDVSGPLIELLRERSARYPNLTPVRSRPNRVPLPDAIADRVLLANLVHGVPPATIVEAVRLLRPGGRLVDVDWRKEPTLGGPPVEFRLSESEASRVLQRYGLEVVARSSLGPAHYVVVGAKPTATQRASSGSPTRRRRGQPAAR